jgi:hypothetical protein
MALICGAFLTPLFIMVVAREHEHPVPAVLSMICLFATYSVMSWLLDRMLK